MDTTSYDSSGIRRRPWRHRHRHPPVAPLVGAWNARKWRRSHCTIGRGSDDEYRQHPLADAERLIGGRTDFFLPVRAYEKWRADAWSVNARVEAWR